MAPGDHRYEGSSPFTLCSTVAVHYIVGRRGTNQIHPELAYVFVWLSNHNSLVYRNVLKQVFWTSRVLKLPASLCCAGGKVQGGSRKQKTSRFCIATWNRKHRMEVSTSALVDLYTLQWTYVLLRNLGRIKWDNGYKVPILACHPCSTHNRQSYILTDR